MPVIKIETNVELAPTAARDMAARASSMCAQAIGKAEQWVLAIVEPGMALVHAGSAWPAAFVQLRSVGLRPEDCPALTAAVCAFLQQELAIDPARVYIEFAALDPKTFGWNGSTLG